MFRMFLETRLFKLQELTNRPPQFLKFIFSFLGNVFYYPKFRRFSKFIRFFEVSYLPFWSPEKTEVAWPKLEILFVATKKDFGTLPYAIEAAQFSTRQHVCVDIFVVVPDSELQECRFKVKDLPVEVQVLPESSILDAELISKINHRFKERAGWVVQQVLKNQFVLKSTSPGVLVVDADTLLIEARAWLDPKGVQLLTPTWEFHQPYYNFLSKLNISKTFPKFTFVPHHMVMQPDITRAMFLNLGWVNIERMVEHLITTPLESGLSPFSVDFELYGQYIFTNYPDKVRIEKWGNFSTSKGLLKEKVPYNQLIANFQNRFASLSFHSYLE